MMDKNRQKLFGTDGIRCRVGRYPLDNLSVERLGRALGKLRGNGKVKILIGRDTRASGLHIERLLAAGIKSCSEAAQIVSCGVIPTPGLSLVTNQGGYDLGIMITASHNPYTDNGIKLFAGNGEKLSAQMEATLEEEFFRLPNSSVDLESLLNVGASSLSIDPQNTTDVYSRFLIRHAEGLGESGLTLVLDCAEGATYQVAQRVFEASGLPLTVFHNHPDGENINRDCGSTEIGRLHQLVRQEGADIGIAFDGDGDRVLFTDNIGNTLDGDHVLLMLARYLDKTRPDFNKTVVGTVMGNLGLERTLGRDGFTYARTDVGDKYVYHEMKRSGSILGGEQSGHTILSCFQVTGDGILTAIYFLKALAYLGMHPSQTAGQLVLFPQKLVNINVTHKPSLEEWPELQQLSDQFTHRHGDDSRLLIRYSGTELKLRVMIESEHQSVIDENIGKFERLIRSHIGKGE